MTFKEKIVKLRKLRGWTQDELAEAVGVSRQAVYKWESGQSYPDATKLVELKVIFNISIDDLLDEEYEVILPEKKKKRRAPTRRAGENKVDLSVNSFFNISKPKNEEMCEDTENTKKPTPVSENTTETTDPELDKAKADAAEAMPDAPKAEQAAPEKEEHYVGFFGKLFGRK